MHHIGEEVPVNYEEAYFWLSLSVAIKFENATKYRDEAAA
jgi:TPR repeat protein